MNPTRTPDYRYETSPEDLQKAIDRIGHIEPRLIIIGYNPEGIRRAIDELAACGIPRIDIATALRDLESVSLNFGKPDFSELILAARQFMPDPVDCKGYYNQKPRKQGKRGFNAAQSRVICKEAYC